MGALLCPRGRHETCLVCVVCCVTWRVAFNCPTRALCPQRRSLRFSFFNTSKLSTLLLLPSTKESMAQHRVVLALLSVCLVLTLCQDVNALFSSHLTERYIATPRSDMNEQLLLQAVSHPDSYAQDQYVCLRQIERVEEQIVDGINFRFHTLACDVKWPTKNGWCDGPCASRPIQIEMFVQPWSNTLKITAIGSQIPNKEPVTEM